MIKWGRIVSSVLARQVGCLTMMITLTHSREAHSLTPKLYIEPRAN